jgi:hypothetical protein
MQQCSAVHLPLQDLEGALKELCEKFAPATVSYFVATVLKIVIEKNEKARVMSGGLFAAMVGTQIHKCDYQNSKYDFALLQVSKQLLEPDQFMAALCEILSLAEDLLVDIPKFWDFIAQVITTNTFSNWYFDAPPRSWPRC